MDEWGRLQVKNLCKWYTLLEETEKIAKENPTHDSVKEDLDKINEMCRDLERRVYLILQEHYGHWDVD